MSEHHHASSPTSPNGRPQSKWWGEFPYDIGAWGFWQVGPLSLWVGRGEHDWEIAYTRGDDPDWRESKVELPADLQQLPIASEAERYRVAYSRTPETLLLRPLLADRAVVARPETAFSIQPRERVSVFVSSAIWVGLSCGPGRDGVLEIPSWRSSDTWFGDNLSGFLCYASRTAMRLDVEELPLRPHRAVTPIVIDNQGNDALKIERISLPIPNLSVFVSPAGGLWTERLQLTRQDDAELAHVHIESDTPPAPGALKLNEPRQEADDNLLSRVFTGLFG